MVIGGFTHPKMPHTLASFGTRLTSGKYVILTGLSFETVKTERLRLITIKYPKPITNVTIHFHGDGL